MTSRYLLLLLLAISCLSMRPATTTLHIDISNIKSRQGTIWIGIYRSADEFLDRERGQLVPVSVTRTGQLTVRVPNLDYAQEYAIALFHDLNDNGEFDRNVLGLPAEPWAFSGQLRSRLRLPYFEEVKFLLDDQQRYQRVRLRQW